MQLVQTSAHDVRVDVDALRRARQQDLIMGGQRAVKVENQDAFLDEKDMEVSSGLVSCILHRYSHSRPLGTTALRIGIRVRDEGC